MVRRCSDVADVKQDVPGKLTLDGGVPVVSRRDLSSLVEAVDTPRKEDARGGRRDRRQVSEVELRAGDRGRIWEHVEHGVALQPVVEHTGANAEHRLRQELISDTESRSILQTAAVDESLGIAVLPGEAHAVGVQAVHEAFAGIDDGANQSSRTLFARQRIDGDALAAGVQPGDAEHARRGRIVQRLVPGGSLQRLIVLRLDPIEAEPVFQGQLGADAPVVLQIPLHVPRTVLSVQHGARLLQGIVVSEQRIRP